MYSRRARWKSSSLKLRGTVLKLSFVIAISPIDRGPRVPHGRNASWNFSMVNNKEVEMNL